MPDNLRWVERTDESILEQVARFERDRLQGSAPPQDAMDTCGVCRRPVKRIDGYWSSIWLVSRGLHDAYICPGCMDSRHTCRSCSTYVFDPEHIINTASGSGCKSCVVELPCGVCGNLIPAPAGASPACNQCESQMEKCMRCSCRRPSNQMLNHKCNNCRSSSISGWSNFKPIVLDYTTNILNTPTGRDFNRSSKKLFFGVELEVAVHRNNMSQYKEVGEATARQVQGVAILKWDRSIDEKRNPEWEENCDEEETPRLLPHNYNGFEIVTKPMGYREQITFWKKFLTERHSLLRGWEAETCGMHIHISRHPFSPYDIGKFQVFLNDPKNYQLVRHIARRNNEQYARLFPKTLSDGYDSTKGGHYDAINIRPSHSSTVEFRIFRSSVRVETVLSNIQFVMALVEFVRASPHSKLSESAFIEYVNRQGKSRFRELREHLKLIGQKSYSEDRIHRLT